jgi:hypothetical protein
MRIITMALVRAKADPEMAKAYPPSYFGSVVYEDKTHIWLRVGQTPHRRTIAIPKASIVATAK